MVENLWQEVCLVSISKQGGSDLNFDAITDEIDFGIAERQVESAKLLNGGRLMLWTPEEDTEISFECYPREVGFGGGNNINGVIEAKYETTTANDITTAISTLKREKFRLAFLWAEELVDGTATPAATAVAATTAGKAAFRMVFADTYCTNIEPDYSEKHLKFNVTFKLGVRSQTADPNMLFESVDGTEAGASLLALDSYTSTVKFRD